MHVPPAGLVEVVATGRGGVGDRAGQRHADAHDHVTGRPAVDAHADDHAGRAGAHEVQRGLVVGRAPDDHRDVEVGDELLEVQRVALGGHVLRRDDRALDDEQVDAGRERGGGELQRVLRGDLDRGRAAALAHLLDPRGDQVGVDRPGVDLLQQPHRGAVRRRLADAPVDRPGVVVARPEALGVEDAEAARLPTATAVAGLTTASEAHV